MAHEILSIFLHLDVVLPTVFSQYGTAIYLILFLVIFCETGLVFTPFLPGDSLLFAAGALTAASTLSIWMMWGLLLAAAIIGDSVNYYIGRFCGERLSRGRFLNADHIVSAHAYFEKYGGKAIILGRFVPIIRTFVPFVAGMSAMFYSRFMMFNIVGALIWVSLLLGCGYWLGQLPWVQGHFSSIILGIMGVSMMPIAVDALRYWLRKK